MSYGDCIVGCSDKQLRKVVIAKLRSDLKTNLGGGEGDEDIMDTVVGIMQLVPENALTNDQIIRDVRKVVFNENPDVALSSYWKLCKLINS